MNNPARKIILQCLQILLKPAAHFCLKHSLTVRELLEAAKVALIEAASRDMEKSGQKVNVSRLSIATGIHRRDVMRLTREHESKEEPINLISRIIGQWEQDARFQTSAGKPKVLGIEGENNEFKDLVYLISQDLNAGTVLFQLERIGAVERSKNGIRLKKRALSIREDARQSYKLLAEDLEDLGCAVQENIYEQSDVPHLHARTEYDNVYKSKVPEIRKWILKEGDAFHKRLRNYLSKFDQDINPASGEEAGSKIVVGTFSRIMEEGENEDK